MELPKVALVFDEAYARQTGEHLVVDQFLLSRGMASVELKTQDGSLRVTISTSSSTLLKKPEPGEDANKQ